MRTVLLLVVLVMAVLLVIFGAQNTQPVNISFLNISTGLISLSLVIIVSAVAGVVLASLVSFWNSIRRGIDQRRVDREHSDVKKRNAELEARISTLERENNDLKLKTTLVATPPPQPGTSGAVSRTGSV